MWCSRQVIVLVELVRVGCGEEVEEEWAYERFELKFDSGTMGKIVQQWHYSFWRRIE